MSARFARALVRFRVAVVVAWIAAAVAAVMVLPTIKEAQTGSLGDLVPVDAAAIDAEERSAELFAFPFASRTLVVERDRGGLAPDRLAAAARRVAELNRRQLPALRDVAGAYGVTNAVPSSFARERGTTAITYLLFPTDIGQGGRRDRAQTFQEMLGRPASSYVGVTGAIPARAAQAEAITSRLPLVEAVTVLLIALTVGLYLRSVVAPLVTLIVVAVAYLAAVRSIAAVGSAIGVSIPSEIEPVLVALLFGVVTDYALFFMSRFRALIAAGEDGLDAARHTTAEVAPIVFTCGVAVAAGSAALAVAELGFLRAFGPAMAVAVLISLAVVLTLLPALLALLGGRLFWPSHPSRAPAAVAGRSRTERLIRTVVRRPVATVALSLLVIAGMGAPVAWLEVGNPVIRGLPSDAEPRQAFEQLERGFVPGVVAPTTLIVEREGITQRSREVRALQSILGDQAGVAGVVGPATSPRGTNLGIVRSPGGDAVRYVIIPATDPVGADAIRRLGNLRVRIDDLTEAVGLDGARSSFAGDTALVGEIIDTTNDDVKTVVPAVLLAVALVLVMFLRALIAPLYLVVLAALAPLASIGLAVVLFQGILGQDLTYFVPIVATVLLVSLGSDYNVFIAGSIWAEARRRPLREAVVAGGSGAAHAIAAAGVVLAASFAALALVPISAFQELAFVLAAGLLIDAFLIRLVLAPAVIVLAERRRSHRSATA